MGKYAFLMFAFVIRFFNFNANAQLNQKDDYVNFPIEKYTFSKFSPTTNLKGILYFTIGGNKNLFGIFIAYVQKIF